MEISEAELRALVREAIARRGLAPDVAAPASMHKLAAGDHANCGSHPSHGRFLFVASGDDGACLIEPAVRCSHCGYCQSFGH
jgi:hypothetical protein